MLYYRRKILLAVIEAFGGKITAISLQKLLFLFTLKQDNKAFDFVPYRYGCFSFQANQDIATLKTYGYLNVSDDGKTIQLIKPDKYISLLNVIDSQYIKEINNDFGNLSQTELVKYTYIHFPYYAIKSAIAHDILDEKQMQTIHLQIKKYRESALFTIGYEGITLETYINKLIFNDIKVLCDVRKNAYSQKYGFSKSQLKTACEGVEIRYLHIPDLGIVSEKRQNLNTQSDYDALFNDYEKTVLKDNEHSIHIIRNLLQNDKRIALTCFEKDPKQCHRSRIAKRLMQGEDFITTLLVSFNTKCTSLSSKLSR